MLHGYHHHFRPLALGISLLLGFPVGAAGEEPSGRAPVDRDTLTDLLNSARESTQAGVRRARELYEPLAGDPAADHAFALVLVEQRRYADALKLTDQLLAAQPRNLGARRLKAWLLALTRNLSAALVELDTLARQLAEPEDDPTALREERLATIRFLGRLHGFLAGPAEREIAATLRDRYRRRLVERLTEAEREEFENAAGVVVETHQVWREESERLKAAAIEDAAVAREQLIAAAEAQREAMARQREALQEQRSQSSAEYRAAADALGNEDAALAGRVSEAVARLEGARRELFLLHDEIARLEADLLRTRNPFIRDMILRRLDYVARLASRQEADLFLLQQQYDTLAIQRAQLAAGMAQERYRLETAQAQLAREYANLNVREQRLDTQILRSTRPASGFTQRVRALEALSAALTSYEPFVFEEERLWLMQHWDQAARGDAPAENR